MWIFSLKFCTAARKLSDKKIFLLFHDSPKFSRGGAAASLSLFATKLLAIMRVSVVATDLE